MPMMMMVVVMGWGRLRAWSRLRTAVGPEHIAGRYAVGAAPEFGSSASAHILGVVRGRVRLVAATRVRTKGLLPLGWIQSKHVEQNGGDIRHHDKGNEHDEP